MTHTRWFLPLVLVLMTSATMQLHADVVLFGSGSNQFSIDFATIGSTGNAPDTTGYPTPPFPTGAVDYTYYMAKFEISESMIAKYNSSYGDANNVAITYISRGPNKPATQVSWNEAARFVNWLNMQVGSPVAYRFLPGANNISRWDFRDSVNFDSNNPYRSKQATFALPTTNEWYKAAYYSPSTGQYNDYGTGSNQLPQAVTSGNAAGTAVYNQTLEAGPADITNAGAVNEYDIMAMTGNVHEWMESALPTITSPQPASSRIIRGGSWMSGVTDQVNEINNQLYLSSSATGSFEHVGFRVVSLSNSYFSPTGGGGESTVPEPGTLVIVTCLSAYATVRTRRIPRRNGNS